jgi:hypothetical protein
MRAAAAELARLVPAGGRFATERDYPAEIRRTGAIHPETWLARASGRNSLNGFNLESSSTPRAALLMNRLEGVSPTRIGQRLARLGVTHVVATSEEFADRLIRSRRFSVAWRSPPVTILALHPLPGQPPPASLLSAEAPLTAALTQPRPEHLGFVLDAEVPTQATVAVAWSPKWHGRLDGRPVGLSPTSDGLVRFSVPAGRHELRLDYRRDGWDRLGVLTTLVAVLAGAVAFARRPRLQRDPGDRGVVLAPVRRRRVGALVAGQHDGLAVGGQRHTEPGVARAAEVGQHPPGRAEVGG